MSVKQDILGILKYFKLLLEDGQYVGNTDLKNIMEFRMQINLDLSSVF